MTKKKRILLICDDIRFKSGISTIAREMVIGTAHHYEYIIIGGAVKHPDEGKKLDLSEDINKHAGINNAKVTLYPVSGYGTQDMVRNLIKIEKPDAIMLYTDPRYFTHIFAMENEIRQQIPIIYLNIWDDLPYPMYNKSYYESCDALLAISKQTENINKVVLQDLAKDKIIKYTPHGINPKYFYPINKEDIEYLALEEFKNKLFKGKKYDFTLLYNARNIRRKSVPDLLIAWKLFFDSLTPEKASKCSFVLHTQPIDENGTDLYAVTEMLFENKEKYNIIFSEGMLSVDDMRMLYNSCDVTGLISSNEGWGLSLTESMMCGKMIIANVQGGMIDQMRFEDENGKWIEYSPEFPSNQFGKYKKHGEWAIPVFPSNISMIGSVATPYIYDSRCDFREVSKAINMCYNLDKEERTKRGEKGKEWVLSDESMMSSKNMCKNIMDGIDELFDKWEPRYRFELIKTSSEQIHPHFTGLPIIY